MHNTLIVIPCFNEASTLNLVIGGLHEMGWEHVVVIDDASLDMSSSIASQSGAEVISLPINIGAWGAIQTGIRYALEHGYSRIVTVDADGQHLPEYASHLTAALDHGANIVVGSCPERANGYKRLVWRMFSFLSGLKIEDLTSGFRAYDARTMELMISNEGSALDYQDVGVLLLAHRHGLIIKEVPVRMLSRPFGTSKVFPSFWSLILHVLATSLISWLRRGQS
jgi:glycosyltransferase involved in cell wall biosynthesis